MKPRVGRPKKSVQPAKGVLSAEGKVRIAEAQRKRWAKSKRADKKAAHAAAVKSVARLSVQSR